MSRISPLVLKKIHLPLDLQSTGTEEYTIAVIFAVNQPPPSRPARPPPGPRFFVRFAVAVAARIFFSAAIVLRSRSRSFFFFHLLLLLQGFLLRSASLLSVRVSLEWL
jgi:hypothetical protein